MTADRRVTLLGGTFDPVHVGHLALAHIAADAVGAEQCWLVPAAIPSLRDRPHAAARDRLDMLEAAVALEPRLRVVDIEIQRGGTSYAIDTFDEVSRRWPDVEPWWVVGADAARHIGRWHRSHDLLAVARFVVVQRATSEALRGDDLARLGFAPDRTVLVDTEPPGVSATGVRTALAEGRDVSAMIPAAVAAIIRGRALYNARG